MADLKTWYRNCVLICLVMYVECLEKESSIVKRSGYQDQVVSASGYAYEADGVGPVSYSSYSIGPGNLPQVTPHFAPFGLGYGRNQHQLKNPAYTTILNGADDFPNNVGDREVYLKGWQPQYGLSHLNLHNHAFYNNHPLSHNYKFSKGDGNNYAQAQNSAAGESAEKGHKSLQQHNENSKGNHLKQGEKEHYSKEGKSASAKADNSGYHSQNSEAGNGAKGASYGDSKSHRKGSKTTGFHKVYHKDEYKKDHSFYDESDSSGHHDKYEKGGSKFSKESGAFEKGGKSDEGSQRSEYGAEGFSDGGKYENKDSGRKDVKEASEFYRNNKDYKKKDGGEYADQNGYAVSEED